MTKRTHLGKLASILLLVAALALPVPALSDEMPDEEIPIPEASTDESGLEAPKGPNPAVMAFDAIVLRPFGFVAFLVGVAAFVPAAIISAPGGLDAIDGAVELFIKEPTQAVFVRPLGRF